MSSLLLPSFSNTPHRSQLLPIYITSETVSSTDEVTALKLLNVSLTRTAANACDQLESMRRENVQLARDLSDARQDAISRKLSLAQDRYCFERERSSTDSELARLTLELERLRGKLPRLDKALAQAQSLDVSDMVSLVVTFFPFSSLTAAVC